MKKKIRCAAGILLILLMAACSKQKGSGAANWIYSATRPQIFQSSSPVVGDNVYYVVFSKNENLFFSVWTSQQTGTLGTDNNGNMYYGDSATVTALNVPGAFLAKVDSAFSASTKDYQVVSEFVDGGSQNMAWYTTNY